MTRYLIAAGLVSLAAAIFAAVGLLEPARLGWTASPPTAVKICLIVLLALPILWLLAYRHQLQSGWALTDESPVTMYAHVEVEEGSDSTGYYVCLRAAPDAPVLHRLAVQRPHGSLDPLRTPQAAKVFIDSRSGKPLVVEVAGHRLWTLLA
ncbi:MAG TPA: hypothetical protein VE756_13540 [Burkholderiales bacterium]|nr:hypothetical protein [Burkholderiales bacterium]